MRLSARARPAAILASIHRPNHITAIPRGPLECRQLCVTTGSIAVRTRKPEASRWMQVVLMKRVFVSQASLTVRGCRRLPFLSSRHPTGSNFAFYANSSCKKAVLISSTLRNLVGRSTPCSDHANAVLHRPTTMFHPYPRALCRPDSRLDSSIVSCLRATTEKRLFRWSFSQSIGVSQAS